MNLILAIHNHQPVGNLDEVFETACDRAYAPLLAQLDRFPEIRVVLHYSGSLLEWFERRRPNLLDHISAMARDGRAELMGGGFYDPVFAVLPERDRRGQIELYTEYLRDTLGASVQGAWLAERVWEQELARSLVDAGIEYTVVDDWHFKQAGLCEDALTGYFLTEDQGRLLRVFPADERLRYLIPFGTVEETIEYLKSLATEAGDRTVVYADDGEKFGLWPETHKHVYEDGWLADFFGALRRERSWLTLATFSEALRDRPPAGRIYLPDCSYREMGGWALPPQRQVEWEEIVARVQGSPGLDSAQAFIRGGFWRNFRVKYPESNLMYARMLEVSERVDALRNEPARWDPARRELYMGQCNCAYWHGVFGGLYLPHLRSAVYRHLLRAENLAEEAEHGGTAWAEGATRDFDFDGADEVRIASDKLVAYFKPSTGGQMYELDVRGKDFNMLATLARRHEAYHHKLLLMEEDAPDNVFATHERGTDAEDEDTAHRLRYDWYDRASLIDHFFAPGVGVRDVARGRYGEDGDFIDQAYGAELSLDSDSATLQMRREGHVWVGHERRSFAIEKTFRLAKGQRALHGSYRVCNLDSRPASATFGVEFNFAMLAGGAPGRYYVDRRGQTLGSLISTLSLAERPFLGITDEPLGLAIALEINPEGRIWTFPVQTVSQCEDGFELLYQSSVVMPVWDLALESGSDKEITIRLLFDDVQAPVEA